MSSSNRFSYSPSPQCCPPLALFNLSPPVIHLAFPTRFFLPIPIHHHNTTYLLSLKPHHCTTSSAIQSCLLPRSDADLSTRTRSGSCAHSHLQSLRPNHCNTSSPIQPSRGDVHISTRTQSRRCAHSHLQPRQTRPPPNHPDRRHPHLSLTCRLVRNLNLRLTHQYHHIRPRHNPASTRHPLSPTRTLSPISPRLSLTTCTSIHGWRHQTCDMTWAIISPRSNYSCPRPNSLKPPPIHLCLLSHFVSAVFLGRSLFGQMLENPLGAPLSLSRMSSLLFTSIFAFTSSQTNTTP